MFLIEPRQDNLCFLSVFYSHRQLGLSSTMATNVDAKLLKQTKFPPEFSQKVDMKKVNVEVMKK